MKEYKLVVFELIERIHPSRENRWHSEEPIHTFYEETYEEALLASIEILEVNPSAHRVEIYNSRRKYSYNMVMLLAFDDEDKKVYPVYDETIVRECQTKEDVMNFCLVMDGKIKGEEVWQVKNRIRNLHLIRWMEQGGRF